MTPRGEFEKTIDWVNRATQYTYTTAEGGEFYVYCTVSIERSAADAITGHAANNKPIGNTFTALIGKTSVMLVYSGIYFETEDDFRELIQEKIKPYRS